MIIREICAVGRRYRIEPQLARREFTGSKE
jgi:hypothetical protein